MEVLMVNQTSHTEFVLYAFPGILRFRYLLAIPFSALYVVILATNSMIVHRILVEKTLHTPMYILISVLLMVNLSSSTTLLPKMILSFLGLNQITLAGCLSQMFSIYSCMMMESILMLLMALDRYVAITRPLHYWESITKYILVTFTVNGLIRICFVVIPLVALAARVWYCKSSVIPHFLCENQILLHLSCGDISKNQIVGMMVRTVLTACDVTMILVSYLQILRTAMKIAVGSAQNKALHTCSTHLLAVITTYLTGFLATLLYITTTTISYDVQNVFSTVSYVLTPTVNPFIFGLRMKRIRDGLPIPWKTKAAT